MSAPSFLQDLQYRLEFAGLKLGLGLFRLLGLDRASGFGGWLFRTVGPRLPITRIARTNMARAMPELSAAEIERYCADMWDNLGRTAAEYAHIDTLAGPERDKRISITGQENVAEVIEQGKPAIFISGHIGNWELLPLCLGGTSLPERAGEVYRHANNPYVDKWMVNLRAKHIIPIQVPKGGPGGRQIITLMREKRSLCMLVDQKMNNGIRAHFFGVPAMTTPSAALLALRFDAPIFLVTIKRKGGAYFDIHIHPPMKVDQENDNKTEIARLTQALNDALEAHIRTRPHEWFWLHNRWPKDAVNERVAGDRAAPATSAAD